MAITNFIPKLWAAAVQVPYQKALVFGQPTVVNTKYEGQIKQQGNSVQVTSIGDPTISDYDKTTDLNTEDLSDTSATLNIDQGKYFSFRVNDVDAVQAAGDFRSPATDRAGFLMADKVDQYIASLHTAALAANKLGQVHVMNRNGTTTTGQTVAFEVLLTLEEKLNEASVPQDGRYVTVFPQFMSALIRDERFIKAANSADGGSTLRNGFIGRALGFDVLLTNNAPTITGAAGGRVVQAGIPDAISFADQITETEALRDQKRFADIVRGLNVFGAKVFRPEGIATAVVSMETPA
jgi:hypothetical protein